MKNNPIVHSFEEAKIYQKHYKPSLNIFRIILSFVGVFVSGSSPAANTFNPARKRAH